MGDGIKASTTTRDCTINGVPLIVPADATVRDRLIKLHGIGLGLLLLGSSQGGGHAP